MIWGPLVLQIQELVGMKCTCEEQDLGTQQLRPCAGREPEMLGLGSPAAEQGIL